MLLFKIMTFHNWLVYILKTPEQKSTMLAGKTLTEIQQINNMLLDQFEPTNTKLKKFVTSINGFFLPELKDH